MADQSSSTTVDTQTSSSSAFAPRNVAYNAEQVRGLLRQGVEAEHADKWEDATEFYSKALEQWYAEIPLFKRTPRPIRKEFPPPSSHPPTPSIPSFFPQSGYFYESFSDFSPSFPGSSCPDVNDRAAILARGFDPLLANLLFMYGNALLTTYTLNNDMLGDKAEKKADETAAVIEGNGQTEVEAALLASLVDGATAQLLQAMQAQEWAEGDEEGAEGDEEGAEGDEEEGEDVEEIDADAEAAVQNGEEKQANAEKEGEEGEEGEEEEGEEGEEEEGEGGDQQDGENGEDKEPELNDLELAWQVLEIARVVYATQTDRQLELSDVHFTLGSVALEDDKQPEAKAEFEKALKYAEEANSRRAQSQVLLLLSSISETTNAEEAAALLERAKTLMKEEIEQLRTSDPKANLQPLEATITEIESRIFALNEKFVPVNPDDVKDFPDPSKGKLTFSFNAPAIASGSGPAAETDSSVPVTVLQPKKKVKPTENAAPGAPAAPAVDPILDPVDEASESRGQKRSAIEIEATEEIYADEPVAKRAKVAEE